MTPSSASALLARRPIFGKLQVVCGRETTRNTCLTLLRDGMRCLHRVLWGTAWIARRSSMGAAEVMLYSECTGRTNLGQKSLLVGYECLEVRLNLQELHG